MENIQSPANHYVGCYNNYVGCHSHFQVKSELSVVINKVMNVYSRSHSSKWWLVRLVMQSLCSWIKVQHEVQHMTQINDRSSNVRVMYDIHCKKWLVWSQYKHKWLNLYYNYTMVVLKLHYDCTMTTLWLHYDYNIIALCQNMNCLNCLNCMN